MKKISVGWIFCKTSFANIFLEKSGGKRILNRGSLALVFWMVGMGFVYKSVFRTKKTVMAKAVVVDVVKEGPSFSKVDPIVPSHNRGVPSGGKKPFARKSRIPPKIKYDAPQIVARSAAGDFGNLPMGTSAVGKLLGGIDTGTGTRNGLARVLLPYGMSFKGGEGVPPNSVVFGSVSRPRRGDRVFMTFRKGVTPEGREFALNAHALDPRDFSPGIRGELHSNAGTRAMGTVGLSMVGVMGEVLVEKEALGQGAVVTPKSTVKNAALSGLSRVAEQEGERRVLELEGQREYVTLPAGQDLIVSLVEGMGN